MEPGSSGPAAEGSMHALLDVPSPGRRFLFLNFKSLEQQSLNACEYPPKVGHARVSAKVQSRPDVEKDLTLLGQELRCFSAFPSTDCQDACCSRIRLGRTLQRPSSASVLAMSGVWPDSHRCTSSSGRNRCDNMLRSDLAMMWYEIGPGHDHWRCGRHGCVHCQGCALECDVKC